jgi:TRAP-type C4-dicarboxylate transport system permease small subunit
MCRQMQVLAALDIVALIAAAAWAWTAPNWQERSPALGLCVVLAVAAVYIFSTTLPTKT